MSTGKIEFLQRCSKCGYQYPNTSTHNCRINPTTNLFEKIEILSHREAIRNEFIEWMAKIVLKYRCKESGKDMYQDLPAHVVEAIDHNLCVVRYGQGKLILEV